MSDHIKNICNIIKFPKDGREVCLPRGASAYQPLSETGVVLCGVSEVVKGYEIKRLVPETHIVIFTTEGEGVFIAGGEKFILEKNSLFISPVGWSQHYYPLKDKWNKFWFHLDDIEYWEYLKKNGSQKMNALRPAPLLSAMREFVSESISNMPEANRAARFYADLICVYLRRELRHSSSPSEMIMHGKLSGLWDAAYGNLKKKWTLDEMAKTVCLSPAHFSRVCKEHYKMSPFQILTKLRMQRAEELLKSSNMKLAAVAESVGYDNAFAFSVAFKRVCGISPKEFKRKPSQEKP